MRRAILQSVVVAACTLATGGVADVVYLAFLNPHHLAWERVHRQGATVILSHSYGRARPGDSIYACTTPFMLAGLIPLHQDLGCYCAPETLGAAALGARLGGECVVDELHPSRADAASACQHAVCDWHIDP